MDNSKTIQIIKMMYPYDSSTILWLIAQRIMPCMMYDNLNNFYHSYIVDEQSIASPLMKIPTIGGIEVSIYVFCQIYFENDTSQIC